MNRWVLRHALNWPVSVMQRCMSVSPALSSVKAHEHHKTKRPNEAQKRTPKRKIELKSVKVRRSMSVKELAEAIGRSVDHINECLSFVEGGEMYRSRNGAKIIDNFDTIMNLVQLNGFKAQVEQVKKSNDEDEG